MASQATTTKTIAPAGKTIATASSLGAPSIQRKQAAQIRVKATAPALPIQSCSGIEHPFDLFGKRFAHVATHELEQDRPPALTLYA